jgi:hypothetical protein
MERPTILRHEVSRTIWLTGELGTATVRRLADGVAGVCGSGYGVLALSDVVVLQRPPQPEQRRAGSRHSAPDHRRHRPHPLDCDDESVP